MEKKEKKSSGINVRLTHSDKSKLERLAAEEDMDTSVYVRRVIRQHIRQHEPATADVSSLSPGQKQGAKSQAKSSKKRKTKRRKQPMLRLRFD